MIATETTTKYRVTRSWRGCDVKVNEENQVTLVPIPDRVAGVLAESQIVSDPMPLLEAHKKCEQLNKVQIASGYLDWLYSPIPADADLPEYDKEAWEALTK